MKKWLSTMLAVIMVIALFPTGYCSALGLNDNCQYDSEFQTESLDKNDVDISYNEFENKEDSHPTGDALGEIVFLDYEINIPKIYVQKYNSSNENESLLKKTSTRYAYNDLSLRSNADARIELYNHLYSICADFYVSNRNINPVQGYYIIDKISLNEFGLTSNEAAETYFVFKNDNPIFYFLDYSLIVDDENNLYITIFADYASSNIRADYNSEIESKIDEYDDLCKSLNSNLEKITAIREKMCKEMYYSLDADGNPSTEAWAHNVVGALCEGKGVCDSYARTFALLLNFEEIENVFVGGRSHGERHAWNLVKIDDYYYWFDCTWDDIETELSDNYFAVGTYSFDDHIWDLPSAIGGNFLYALPTNISNDDYIKNYTLYKNGDKLCNFNVTQAAFDKMTDKNASYKLEYSNIKEETLPSGSWPDVKEIELYYEGDSVDWGEGFSQIIYQNLYLDADVEINSDVVLTNVAINSTGDFLINSSITCVKFDINDYTLLIRDNVSFGNYSIEYEGEYVSCTGINVLGDAGSKVVGENSAGLTINANVFEVDTVDLYSFIWQGESLQIDNFCGDIACCGDAIFCNVYGGSHISSFNAPNIITVDKLCVNETSFDTNVEIQIGSCSDEKNLPIVKINSAEDSAKLDVRLDVGEYAGEWFDFYEYNGLLINIGDILFESVESFVIHDVNPILNGNQIVIKDLDVLDFCHKGADGSISISDYDIFDLDDSDGCQTIVCADDVTEYVIPEDVETLFNYSFWYFPSLETVKMGTSVISLYADTFYRCSSLKDIYIYGYNTKIYDGFEKNYLSDVTIHCIEGSNADLYAKENDIDVEYIEHTHNIESSVIQLAGCNQTGIEEHICEECGFTETIDIGYGTHLFSPWRENDEDTHIRTCDFDCGTQEVEAHNWDEGTVMSYATDESDGETKYVCLDCGAEKTVTTSKHTYDDGVVLVPATCMEDGYKQYTCTDCGNTKVEIIPATGHDLVWEYDDDIHQTVCKNCSFTTNLGGHIWELDSSIEATCEENGIKTYICADCGATKTEVITMLGHVYGTWVNFDENQHQRVCANDDSHVEKADHNWDEGFVTTPATCEADGIKTFTCIDCDAKKAEIIPALTHNYGAWTKLDDNQHQRVCANDDSHVEKANHNWDKGIVTTPATCTEDGVKTFTCSDCDAKKTEAIPALTHNYGIWIKLDDNQHQRVCANDDSHVEKANHNWDKGVVKTSATCTADGVKVFTCSDCNATKTEIIAKLGHNYVNGKCTRCGTLEPGAVGANNRLFSSGYSTIRYSGNSRYETSFATANALKTALGVSKFKTIIVADGNNFADALAGSYLAAKKSAPILMVNAKNGDNDTSGAIAYISKNLEKGGTIYILGGTNSVSAKAASSYAKYGTVKRIAGDNRYATNLAILKEAGGVSGQDLLICDGSNFADALSCSALGKPLLLVDKYNIGLSGEQKSYVKSAKNIYIIGGTGSVPEQYVKLVGKAVTRVAGADRFETSLEIAKKFSSSFAGKSAVIATGANFPDGLSGGPLAYALGAPLILTNNDSWNYNKAKSYVGSKKVVTLGGVNSLADSTVKTVRSGNIESKTY